MKKFSPKQFVEDLKSRGATPEEVNQIVKNYVQKLLNAGKRALAAALIVALLASVVACDVLENPNASTTEPVYVTDEYGSVVTDESGNPIVANPESEEFTYPEFETEVFQTLSSDELRLDFFNYFELKKALSGFYMNRFYEEVYDLHRDEMYRGELLGYYSQESLQANLNTTDAISNLLNSNNKSFTLEISVTNQQILTYSLVVDDAKQVLAIVAKDKYTGEERILNGIVGDKFYTEYETPITLIRNKDKSSIISYLADNTFADFTSNILAYIPSCIFSLTIPIPSSSISEELSTSVFLTHYSDNEDVWNHELRNGPSLILVSTGTGERSVLNSLVVRSDGFSYEIEGEDEKVPVPLGAILVEASLNYDQLPKRILSELGEATEQEIPVEPETKTGTETN